MPKTMYHVSRKDLGSTVTLTPKVPESANPRECRETARICFSPTVEQCLVGITGNSKLNLLGLMFEFESDQPTVYVTRSQLVTPSKVSDYGLTGEQWAVKPHVVKRAGYVNLLKSVKRGKLVVQVTKPDISSDEMKEFHKSFRMFNRAQYTRVFDPS